MASISNFWLHFHKQFFIILYYIIILLYYIKFDKLCRTTWLCHGTDSAVPNKIHKLYFISCLLHFSYVTSVNLEFGMTLAGCLNQSHVSAMLKSSLIKTKFGTAEAGSLELGLIGSQHTTYCTCASPKIIGEQASKLFNNKALSNKMLCQTHIIWFLLVTEYSFFMFLKPFRNGLVSINIIIKIINC